MVISQKGMMAKMMSNLKPAIFVRREDPATLENCLRDIEKIFTITGTLEKQKVDQATFQLWEDADRRWKTQGPTIRAKANFNWEDLRLL